MSEKLVLTEALEGVALDWAVGCALGWKEPVHGIGPIMVMEDQYLAMTAPDYDSHEEDVVYEPHHFVMLDQWSPSRRWDQCGLLIRAYKATFDFEGEGYRCVVQFDTLEGPLLASGWGTNHLIATCRAIVVLHRGPSSYIPVEYLK